MVLKVQVRTCELHCHEKKKLPNPFDIEVTGPDMWRQFQENSNFCFYGPIGTRSRPVSFAVMKKKKKDFPNPHDVEVTVLDLWHQFRKNQNFWFYGPRGAGQDL